MGKRGPAPRASHLKALEGCREDRINRNAPVPASSEVSPTPALLEEARRYWDLLAPDMEAQRVLTAWDAPLFTAFCNAAALYERAAKEVEDAPTEVAGSHGGTVLHPAYRALERAEAQMRALGSRFGLSPGDRAQLRLDLAEKPSAGGARLLS